MLSSGYVQGRRNLRARPDGEFVDRWEFCWLLVSSRRITRADETAAGIRGLLDLDRNIRYLIEEEKLFPPLK